jgi:hypothetical protein
MMRLPWVNACHQDMVVLNTTEGVAGVAGRLARGRVRALPPFAPALVSLPAARYAFSGRINKVKLTNRRISRGTEPKGSDNKELGTSPFEDRANLHLEASAPFRAEAFWLLWRALPGIAAPQGSPRHTHPIWPTVAKQA